MEESEKMKKKEIINFEFDTSSLAALFEKCSLESNQWIQKTFSLRVIQEQQVNFAKINTPDIKKLGGNELSDSDDEDKENLNNLRERGGKEKNKRNKDKRKEFDKVIHTLPSRLCEKSSEHDLDSRLISPEFKHCIRSENFLYSIKVNNDENNLSLPKFPLLNSHKSLLKETEVFETILDLEENYGHHSSLTTNILFLDASEIEQLKAFLEAPSFGDSISNCSQSNCIAGNRSNILPHDIMCSRSLIATDIPFSDGSEIEQLKVFLEAPAYGDSISNCSQSNCLECNRSNGLLNNNPCSDHDKIEQLKSFLGCSSYSDSTNICSQSNYSVGNNSIRISNVTTNSYFKENVITYNLAKTHQHPSLIDSNTSFSDHDKIQQLRSSQEDPAYGDFISNCLQLDCIAGNSSKRLTNEKTYKENDSLTADKNLKSNIDKDSLYFNIFSSGETQQSNTESNTIFEPAAEEFHQNSDISKFKRIGMILKNTASIRLHSSEILRTEKLLEEEKILVKKIEEKFKNEQEIKIIEVIKNDGDDFLNQTNLHQAVLDSNMERVYCLVENQKRYIGTLFEINHKDVQGKTALDYALEKKMNNLIIDYLKENLAVQGICKI